MGADPILIAGDNGLKQSIVRSAAKVGTRLVACRSVIERKARRAIERLWFAAWGLYLRRFPVGELLPVSSVLVWRRGARLAMPWLSDPLRLEASERELHQQPRSSVLKECLESAPLGGWSLDAETVDWLWDEVQRCRPACILECGSGVSTVLWAAYARDQGLRAPAVISLEQDQASRTETIRRLERHELQEFAAVVYAPLDVTASYSVEVSELDALLEGKRADWVLIDGPAGHDGVRVTTLPALASLCRSGARWFLDDAYRDGELAVLQAWSKMPSLRVEGIRPTLHGLATGVIVDPDSVRAEFAPLPVSRI
jgi:hypothetical protein